MFNINSVNANNINEHLDDVLAYCTWKVDSMHLYANDSERSMLIDMSYRREVASIKDGIPF